MIDHPPGSPVFTALMAKINAAGCQLTLRSECDLPQTEDTIIAYVVKAQSSGGTGRWYEKLVEVATLLGIELED